MLHSRWKPWSDNGVSARIAVVLAVKNAVKKIVLIDVTYRKMHPAACSLRAQVGA